MLLIVIRFARRLKLRNLTDPSDVDDFFTKIIRRTSALRKIVELIDKRRFVLNDEQILIFMMKNAFFLFT